MMEVAVKWLTRRLGDVVDFEVASEEAV